MEALENNQRQLEPHTLYHGQPMEFIQHDVVSTSFACRPDTTSGRRQQLLAWRTSY